MKAVRFEKNKISMIDTSEPEVHDDEAMVRITMAGICATDIGLYRGYADFSGTPGHEFVGVVQKCVSRPHLVGKRVVSDINCGCGICNECICGDPRHCLDRKVIGIRGRNGAFAEFCTVPSRNLHPVPDQVETISAVFAEPLAAALRIADQLHITGRSKVAVLGDGKLGILTAMALKHYTENVLLIGKHSEKLEIALDRGVATACPIPGENNDYICKRLGRFDMTVDATGSPDGINMAVSLTRPQGIVVVKTTVPENPGIDLSSIAVNELHLVGSRCGDLSIALHFLENKWIDVAPLVDKVYSFCRFEEAFYRAMERQSLKVIVAMDGAEI